LDEAHGYAYVAEFTGGHIQRIRLSNGAKSVVATIATPRGVLVTGDGRFIYVSTDASTITRFDLVTNTHVVVASAGLNGPRYLTWADAGESTILFPQPNPTGTVLKADLTTTPASCLRTRRICQSVTRTRPWTRRTSSRSRTARSEGPCH